MSMPPPPPPGSGGDQPPASTGGGQNPPPPGGNPPSSPGGTPPAPQYGTGTPYGSAPPPPPGQPPYGTGGPGGPGGQPADNSAKTLGFVSLGTGIVSIICCLCWPLSLLSGIGAIVTGFLGRKKGQELGDESSQKFALAGLILGIIGVVIVAVLLIISAVTGGFDYQYNYDDWN